MSIKKKRRKGVPLKEWLDAEFKDPEFKQFYDEISIKRRVAMEIIAARQKASLTQRELAQQIGDRQQNVSRIESGEQNVTVGTLGKIAKAVGGRLIVKIETGSSQELEAGVVRDKGRRKQYRAKPKLRK
ncbi:helix-turn-helix transcriptional regulator [bacterium]|nr:helix-turn-helix transcriptional regulator [bacterium]